jgi:hypothetical protein
METLFFFFAIPEIFIYGDLFRFGVDRDPPRPRLPCPPHPRPPCPALATRGKIRRSLRFYASAPLCAPPALIKRSPPSAATVLLRSPSSSRRSNFREWLRRNILKKLSPAIDPNSGEVGKNITYRDLISGETSQPDLTRNK